MKPQLRVYRDPEAADPDQNRAALRAAAALWACLFFLIFAVAIARSVGAALFLNRYGGRELALVYMLVGAGVLGIIYGLSWLTHGVRYDRLAIGSIVAFGLGTAVYLVLLSRTSTEGRTHSWVYGSLYVYLETFSLVSTMQVWSLANSHFTAAQAKRLYVFLATGGIFGCIAGGMVTRLFRGVAGDGLLWMVVASCPAMIVAILVFNRYAKILRTFCDKELFVGPAMTRTERRSLAWLRHPLLRHRAILGVSSKLAALAFLTAVTTNWIDFYFKTYADEQFHGDVEQLKQFFGGFYLLTGVTSLFMQLFVTRLVVRYSSAFGGLALMPAVLSFCTGFNWLGPTLVRATVLKLMDSGFAHSVHRSCTEMLYTPLPPNITGEIKLLSEGVASRAGLVVTGMTLFLLAPVLTPHRTLLLIFVLLICWFAALVIVRRAYRSTSPKISDDVAESFPSRSKAA